MSGAGHTVGTPLPWRLHTYNDGHRLGYIQGSPLDGEKYGDAVVLNFAKPTSPRSHANAAFIVRACNSHYELLEALETTRALVVACAPSGFTDHDAVLALYENNDALTAVLAKATGGAA